MRTRSTRRYGSRVFGQPTDAILEALCEQAGNGVELSVNGEHLGGFTRSVVGGL
jgi:hypothetical protein